MPASFQDILNSRLFKFIVGEKVDGHAKEFFVHEEAIVQLSKPLEALMRGGMTESQAGCTVWDDVSKETFERFVQFAYTGDYTVPVPVSKMRVEDIPDSLDMWNWGPKTSKKKKKKRGTGPLFEIPPPEPAPAPPELAEPAEPALTLASTKLDSKVEEFWFPRRFRYLERTSIKFAADFKHLTFPLLAVRNNYDKICEPNEQFDPEKSYSNVFISHAALYILGDFRLIDSLKALALYKLHKTLCVFQLSNENIKDVIDLTRYVYAEEGGEEGSGGEIGALRSLVCHYMAMNALVLSLDDGFMDLLGEGGQFVKDFFKFEVQRVSK
ncbi:hypothetical protein BCON_0136g00250 [Botryotinia convoluta]|uniref:BTB domain-containing protein n=1 Tax=Botryotinia convoluta TaxID=54673 RepID=A0A4Z1HU93_9HELO|nr:hypothetical protein BCON_0136g00250 [Botryotinia convoluta]